ncbi:MAG: DMT family transporter [Gammaproteobacteria bacterium]|nr:DMT family transporter [Gammaproteobacteria bacterium]
MRALVAMALAVAAFAGMDALLKLLAVTYPPMQVATLRGASALPFLLLPLWLTGRWQLLRPQRLSMHLLRGALWAVVLGCFVFAVRTLSLANAYAVFLSAPLLMTALAVPILKERAARHSWVAIGVGLVGVLIILRPNAGIVSVGLLAAFGAAVGYALSCLAVRVLTRTDSTASVVVWAIAVMTLLAGVSALPHWVPLESRHLPWLVGLGMLAAVGSYLVTDAFRHAPAAVVAPLEYTSLLWGMLIDRLVWHVLPAPRMLLGAGIVIASGLYLIWHERRASLAPAQPSLEVAA